MTLLATSIQAPRRMGIGVGAVVVNEDGRVLLIRRGPGARNEQGLWATPGGALTFSETLEEAVRREVWEECGIEIAVLFQLGTFDHRLPDGERWVSIAYLAQIVSGSPSVREPEKCCACSWFAFDALPTPLSPLAQMHLAAACATSPDDGVWPCTESETTVVAKLTAASITAPRIVAHNGQQ